MNARIEPAMRNRIESALGHRGLKIALAIAIVTIAILVLHHLAADVPWPQVKADIAAVSAARLLAVVFFTALSFAALSLYDVLAVETVAPGKVPPMIAAMAGACGYAVSNLMGFSWLTGGSLRFRIYSSFGLDWSLVAGVIATSWFSFWLGILFLLGVLMVFHPAGLSSSFGFPPALDTAIGISLLLMIGGVFLWLARSRRSVSIAGFRLDLPTGQLAVAQTLAAIVDVLGAALALYMLLPADLSQNFAFFFFVYVSAVGLGVLSHAPGGIGVFEATIIAGLGAGGRSDILAALTLYRLIYYVLPFAIAAIAMATAFIAARRNQAGQFAVSAHTLAKPLVPPLTAGIALVSGLILLVSGSLPIEAARLDLLRALVPLPVIEASHLAGSIAGVLLIVVARGLYRKQRRAWFIAVGLVILGLLVSLSKGLDWEEAVLLLSALGLLLVFRSAFYRSAGGADFQLTWRWVLPSAAMIAVAIWVGFFAYSNVPYSHDLWWDFAWRGDAPRFLRASLAAAVLFLALSFNALIKGHSRRLPAEEIPDTVRQLIAASTDTESCIALTGDKRFLVDDQGRSFLSYADSGGSLISKGDPVGDRAAGEGLIWRLWELADSLGKSCAFYAVSSEYLHVYLDMGLVVLKIGEVARVDLTDFTLDGSAKKDFRYALKRAARDGFVFEIIRAADLAPHLPALRNVSDAWLELKHGAEKGFALGSFDPAYLANFDHAVLRHAASGDIVAFANLLQAAQRRELSVDLMRHDGQAPGFAMDALFAELLLWGKDRGFQWFSLGAAPLSGMQSHPLATLWNRFGHYVYRHGEHFYHFEGLREFKEKFGPVWSPNYLVCSRGLDAPRILYEVNFLISGGVRGLLK